jgi:hypothetical protein
MSYFRMVLARKRFEVEALLPLIHFFAGAALAAFLSPEGALLTLAALAAATAMKALYDYLDVGRVHVSNLAGFAAGGVLVILATGLA